MAQVWKVRLPDGRTLIPGDWTSAEPLYSTIEIGSAAFSVLTAFSYGQGGSVPGSVGPRDSNLADTNLQGEGARLPENEELICYNLAIEIFKIGDTSESTLLANAPDVSLFDMLRLQRDLYAVFRIAFVKEYTHSPISYFPASTGVYQYNGASSVQVNAAADVPWVASNNGMPNAYDVRTFASPLYAAGGESIAVDIKAGSGQVDSLADLGTDDRYRFRIFLDGYRRRPVA